MNTYEMILDICDWMRQNPDSPFKRELLFCKSQDEMRAKWAKFMSTQTQMITQ